MRKKRINWNQARNMDVDAWRERQIQKRLTAYLEQREQEFIRDHAGDTDDRLTVCVQMKARELGRMPHPLELPGENTCCSAWETGGPWLYAWDTYR